MDFMRYLNDTAASFTLREKRPGIMKLIAPFYHEDGDMIDIFLKESEFPGKIRICDFGLSLMRLSYTMDIDTDVRKQVLESIISKNNMFIDNGDIFLDVVPTSLTSGIFHFASTLGKVCNMDILNRENMRSMFYELLHEQINEKFSQLSPKEQYAPTKDTELLVDYAFPKAPRPLFLFGIQEQNKAKKAAIACLTFKNENLKFRSIMIHEDFENLPRYDRKQLTNIADKQFTDLDEFKNKGIDYILAELSEIA